MKRFGVVGNWAEIAKRIVDEYWNPAAFRKDKPLLQLYHRAVAHELLQRKRGEVTEQLSDSLYFKHVDIELSCSCRPAVKAFEGKKFGPGSTLPVLPLDVCPDDHCRCSYRLGR